jgi:gamma-glutamylcyclotransferase
LRRGIVEVSQGTDQVQEGAFLYFAYGSNMLTERLQKRCPSVRPLGNAMARGFSLTFSKRGNDGSGKAMLVKTGEKEEAVYGVLFGGSQSEQTNLDKAEGRRKGCYRDDAFMVVRVADGK